MQEDFFDSLLYRIGERVAECLVLSLLWLLFSLPLVTMGAATAALHTTTWKILHNQESGMLRTFWCAFCSKFKRATQLWLAINACAVIFMGDMIFFFRLNSPMALILCFLTGTMLFVLLLTLVTAFHLPMEEQQGLRTLMKNSVFFALGHLKHAVANLLLLVVTLFGMCASFALFAVGLFFGAGMLSFVSAMVWRPVLEKYFGR